MAPRLHLDVESNGIEIPYASCLRSGQDCIFWSTEVKAARNIHSAVELELGPGFAGCRSEHGKSYKVCYPLVAAGAVSAEVCVGSRVGIAAHD